MTKKLLTIAGIILATITSNKAQNFSLLYPFTSVTGTANLITTDPTPAPTAAGVTSGSFMAVGTGTGSTAAGYFSFTGWPTGATNGNDATFTGALNTNAYYNITITPQASYSISVTSISFQVSRSSTGIRTWAVRSSADNYSNNITPIACSNTNIAVNNSSFTPGTFFWSADSYTAYASQSICSATVSNLMNQTSPLSFRLYGFNAEGSFGTFRLDSMIINGNAVFSPGTGLPKLSHDVNAKFILFPNPSNSGKVTIQGIGKAVDKIELINALGSLIEKQEAISEDKIIIDTNDLPAGTYYVRITSGKNTAVEKLVILK
jgi:hypothetical protein